MPNKGLVAWTVFIGGYVQAGRYKEALRLFEEIEATGLETDEVMVVTVLSACVQHGTIGLAKRLHRRVNQNGLVSRNARVATSFVHKYMQSMGAYRQLWMCFVESPSTQYQAMDKKHR